MLSRLPLLRLASHSHQHAEHTQDCYSQLDLESNMRMVLVKDRWEKIWRGIHRLLSIGLLYLATELLIWGLSLALAPAKLEFFSSVLGMLLVFTVMLLLHIIVPNFNIIYEKHVKSHVDFINRHMGVAFAIPMVMLNGENPMHTRTIGLVVGAFVAISLLAWLSVFMLAKLTEVLVMKLFQKFHSIQNPQSTKKTAEMSGNSPGASRQDDFCSSTDPPSFDSASLRQPALWTWLSRFWVLIFSFLCIFAVGLPLAMVRGDHRILDVSVVWFMWMSAVILQRSLKRKSKSYTKVPRIFSVLMTLANPVLITILLMTAYTRAKACAMSTGLSDVLYRLSSGTPLYTLWTLKAQRNANAASLWFGAGDATLSLLGCGFVAWGFKLYECRRQLFSPSGLVTVLVSAFAAAGNVFLGTYAAFFMGLERPEALAFAARVTTLALAIPAMKNVGGNTSLAVALMITSGVLGQLAYPSALGGIDKDCGPQIKRKPSTESCSSSATAQTTASASTQVLDCDETDGTNTVAAGIAIGVNGGAMGVAYLYEHKSPSASYAALAMTTYGVVTVVFIAVNPFKAALLSLA